MITISHILCPVDFSEYSARAVAHALAMARWYRARLTMLHVCVNLPRAELPPIVLGDAERAQLLDELRRFAGPHEGVSVDFHVQEASEVHQAILDHAGDLGADLLVIGSHGRQGIQRLLLGSVTEKLLRRVLCPLMVVPHAVSDTTRDESVRFEKILCPVDFSESSLAALAYALSIAQEADATLTILHAVDIPPDLSEYMPPVDLSLDSIRAAAIANSLKRLRELIPDSARTFCTVEATVVEGAAYREVLKAAAERHSDLIVMGVHGRGALDVLLFGSNTARVTRAAPCPVLVLRQPR
jgi:nucleotide-binding universal stress UspA family protein